MTYPLMRRRRVNIAKGVRKKGGVEILKLFQKGTDGRNHDWTKTLAN